MDQSVVKQEIWKGMGTQFDPLFAKVMISLIDADVNYDMREIPGEQDEIVFDDTDIRIEWPTSPNEQSADIGMMQETDANSLAAFIMIESKWCNPSEGIVVSNEEKKISFHSITRNEASYVWSAPVVLVYSSDDGTVLGPNYVEHGVFMSAGYGWQAGPSLYEYSMLVREKDFESWDNWNKRNKEGLEHTFHVRMEDNVVVLTFENGLLTEGAHLAVPEEYKGKVFVAFSGLECDISNVEEI